MMNERMTNQSLRERFNLSESKADVSSQIIRSTLDAEMIRLEDPETHRGDMHGMFPIGVTLAIPI